MKTRRIIDILINIPKSIFFNFKYLSPRIAWKLPIIFISGVRLNRLKGTIKIIGKVKTGMVRIGGNTNPLYMQSNHKCIWTNYGGNCTFSENTFISGGSSIEIGQKGNLIFNRNVYFGVLTRIACYESIIIEEECTFSWENIITDTDFHSIHNLGDNTHSRMTKPVKIGKNNWVGIRSCIAKGTSTPDNCIISAYSFLNKWYHLPENVLIGGVPARLLKNNVRFDRHSHVNPLME